MEARGFWGHGVCNFWAGGGTLGSSWRSFVLGAPTLICAGIAIGTPQLKEEVGSTTQGRHNYFRDLGSLSIEGVLKAVLPLLSLNI